MASSSPELPIEYVAWRSRRGDDAVVEIGDREFSLRPLDRLSEEVEIDGRSAPWIEQARLFARSIAEATGETSTFDFDDEEIPFSRIEGFLAIGLDDEDLLCVDPSDAYSVWAFMPSEGGLLEKLHDSLAGWVREAG